jgi:hypothetical protein
MYTTGQGKVHQGVVELAYEVTHPVVSVAMVKSPKTPE